MAYVHRFAMCGFMSARDKSVNKKYDKEKQAALSAWGERLREIIGDTPAV